jgi:nucleotide-binding universal stress UspA family protein
MTAILFPTRGGEASYPNQDRAIALAKEREARLIFMYVADVRFMTLMARPSVVELEEDIEELGEFLLAMAQERAASQGVKADMVVRRGMFGDALMDVIEAESVDVVVLGVPTGSTGITTPSYRQSVIRDLIAEMGVEVIVVDDGDIVARWTREKLP